MSTSADPITIKSDGPVSSFYTISSGIDQHMQIVIRENYNLLKARMMNLAESATSDTRQCNALKGLMKDFLNQAYLGTLQRVKDVLESRGLSDDRCVSGPTPGLDAKGLADIQVD